MNDRELEARLRAWYRTEANETASAPLTLRRDVAAIPRTAPHRSRSFGQGRGLTLLAAAAAVLLVGGALAVGSGVLRLSAVIPPVPSLGPLAIASPSPSESVPPTPVPSPTPVPITWTEASLKQDWPAPVRPEPAGGAGAAAMPPTYIDPSGDAGSNDAAYVDIRDVSAIPRNISFDIMSKPPDVDPSQAWIAYGLVVDTNGDGVPDVRYGIDNLPQSMGQDVHRAWRTDLHTGLTEFDPNPRPDQMNSDFVQDSRFILDTRYPAAPSVAGPSFHFFHSFDTPRGEGHDGARQTKPFYVWASAIVDGQVVATDYAPDTGWLIPTPDGTNPVGTYVVQPDVRNGPSPLRILMNVPSGWQADHSGMNRTIADQYYSLEFLITDQPSACDASGPGRAIAQPVGPTVDDLANFIASLPRVNVSENTEITIDGRSGRYLEYSTTAYDNSCGPPAWSPDSSTPGGFRQAWILDVDGVRLLIDAWEPPNASQAVKEAFGQIVDSISIERTGAALLPTPAPTPTPTPTPLPTPTPTPFPPAAGPIPDGARVWKVTVENKSSKDVTLFLAREPLNDMGDLCGAVTPDVVRAGVTRTVTFQMPPKTVNDCWLMILPGPGAGGAFGPTDGWPIPGPRKFVISDGGDNANGDDLSTVSVGP